MQVILLERMENLGQMGDEVKVSPGYARNFLIPQRKALRANAANRAVFQNQRAQLEAENLKRKSDAEKVAAKIQDMAVILIRQAGEAGQLYGSVTARDIAEAVTQSGCSINRTQITIDQPIKIIGVYPIKVSLHGEVSVTITANIARSDEEAKTQAAAIKAGKPLGAMPPASADDAAERQERAPRKTKGKKADMDAAEPEAEATAE